MSKDIRSQLDARLLTHDDFAGTGPSDRRLVGLSPRRRGIGSRASSNARRPSDDRRSHCLGRLLRTVDDKRSKQSPGAHHQPDSPDHKTGSPSFGRTAVLVSPGLANNLRINLVDFPLNVRFQVVKYRSFAVRRETARTKDRTSWEPSSDSCAVLLLKCGTPSCRASLPGKVSIDVHGAIQFLVSCTLLLKLGELRTQVGVLAAQPRQLCTPVAVETAWSPETQATLCMAPEQPASRVAPSSSVSRRQTRSLDRSWHSFRNGFSFSRCSKSSSRRAIVATRRV